MKSLAPNFKWAGLGNLLGDYGEFIAVEVYDLQPAPRGANGYDAVRPDGKKVHVKTNYAASQIGFRGDADMAFRYRRVSKLKRDGPKFGLSRHSLSARTDPAIVLGKE